jgi:PadR family transcriptional regulator PadR
MSDRVHIGDFELYVLLALAHLGEDAYGMRIRQTIAERTGREVAVGAVYATLGRLEDKGLVGYQLSDPEPVRGGRARKCFGLTPLGARVLRESTTMLTAMLAGIDRALGRARPR